MRHGPSAPRLLKLPTERFLSVFRSSRERMPEPVRLTQAAWSRPGAGLSVPEELTEPQADDCRALILRMNESPADHSELKRDPFVGGATVCLHPVRIPRRKISQDEG